MLAEKYLCNGAFDIIKRSKKKLFISVLILLALGGVSHFVDFRLPSTLSLLIKGPAPNTYALYTKTVDGITQQSTFKVYDTNSTTVRFELPAKKIDRLVIACGYKTGTFQIESICLESIFKKHRWSATEIATDFMPRQDIINFGLKDTLLYFQSTGRSPVIECHPNVVTKVSDSVNLVDRRYMYLLSLFLSVTALLYMDPVAGFVCRYRKELLVPAIFIASFKVALMFHDKLKLPFSNPLGIFSILTARKYNPANDIIRFVFLVMTPALVVAAVFLVRITRGWISTKTRQVLDFKEISSNGLLAGITYILVVVGLFIAVGSYYDHHKNMRLDTFHEGERLGPAIDYLDGKVPYKDTIFLHGAFQDPLSAILAFKIFGKSISAVRTLDLILKIITLLLLLITLYLLYSRNIFFTCMSFFLLLIIETTAPFGVKYFLNHRLSVILIFVILATFIRRVITADSLKIHKWRTHLLLFLFTLIPSAGFAYSLDVGFFSFAASVITMAIIYFLHLRKADFKYIFSILAGYMSGMIVLGFAIRWAYYDFFKFTFIELPQFKDLMDGLVYHFGKIEKLVPVVLMSVWMYWLVYRFINLSVNTKGKFWEKFKSFYTDYFMEILLLILSIFCFRSPLSRSDKVHVWGWSLPVFVLTFFVLSRHYFLPYLSRIKKRNLDCFIRCIIILVVYFVKYLPKVNWDQLYKFPLSVTDAELIDPSYTKTISFLKENLGPDENFFALTSEPIWYYFIDKPCPSRFSVMWFAVLPIYQNEMVENLKANNVKFILYHSDFRVGPFRDVHNKIRIPIVMDYINRNYIPHVKIDDKEIWIRKSGLKSDIYRKEKQ